MVRQTNIVIALALTFLGMAAAAAQAQENITSLPANEPRYQFMAHNFIVDGVEQEIYVKLDRFTGKTWRFHVSTPRWVAISEPTQGLARLPGTAVRYELYPHNYLDQNGDSQELIVRADSDSGYTWMYRGATGSWKDIGQDE